MAKRTPLYAIALLALSHGPSSADPFDPPAIGFPWDKKAYEATIRKYQYLEYVCRNPEAGLIPKGADIITLVEGTVYYGESSVMLSNSLGEMCSNIRSAWWWKQNGETIKGLATGAIAFAILGSLFVWIWRRRKPIGRAIDAGAVTAAAAGLNANRRAGRALSDFRNRVVQKADEE